MEEVSQPGTQIARFADVAMYQAAPNPDASAGNEVRPRVYVVNMTPKPLQAMAAAADLYKGVIHTSPSQVSEDAAYEWFKDMTRTVLEAPLEWIDIHLLFEGVSRAFMDQLRTQRTAVYVAESLRFAVKEHVALEVVMPPSIQKLKDDAPARRVWKRAVQEAGYAYDTLINAGIPAEDARGLLPLNISTRIHYKTNLRNLAPHAGMRLCSQAQHEWKIVWAGIINAIRNYGPPDDRWQQEEITRLFKPICYQTGRCQFRAATDRACSIRDRVEQNYAEGVRPEDWTNINPLEPLMEGAARIKPGRQNG